MTGAKKLGPRATLGCGFAAALLLLYAPVVFGGKTFVLRDSLRFTLPSREFLARSLSSGRLPEWWDGVGFGVAFAGNPVHGVVSPLSWLLALTPSPWAFDALTLVQLLVLSLGAFALAGRLGADRAGALFSGLAVVLSGYVVSTIPNGNVPYITWIPWLAWSALVVAEDSGTSSPRTFAWLSLAGAFALQLLAGEPGHTLAAGLLVLLVVLASDRPFLGSARKLAAPLGTGAGLAAVGLLPAMSLLATSARAFYPSPDPTKFSMHPGRALEWVWPLAFGSEGKESWFIRPVLGLEYGDAAFAFSLYLGLPVLVLAAGAAKDPRIRRLLLGSLVFLVLALGQYTPLFGILRKVVPPLRVVNYPEKFFFGVVLIWCVAAGAGFSRVFGREAPPRWALLFPAAGSAVLAAGAAAVRWNRSTLESLLGSRAAGIRLGEGLDQCVAGAVVAALGGGLFAAAVWLRKRGGQSFPILLAFVGVSVPLLFSARSITPLASRSLVERTPGLLARLPRSPLAQADVRPRLFLYPAPRIRPPLPGGEEIAAEIEETLDTNVAARFGYDILPGFETGDSACSRRFWEEVSPRMSLLAFVRLLGVDFAMVPDPARYAPGFPILASSSAGSIVGTFPVRPRAFVAPRATPAASAAEGLDSLAWDGRERDPARVVVSGTGAEKLDVPGPLEPCGIKSARPEDVSLRCESPGGGYAVLLDENLPGWSAQLDGQPAPILTADGLFRAVRVPPGEHRIAFLYRAPGLRTGAALSALTLAALLAAAFVPGRGRRPE